MAERDPAPESVFERLTDTLDPPLLVVTAADGAERAGCVVGFHSQCSLEPLRYALWLSTVNRTYRVALRSDYLGIHLLGVDDDGLGRWFGGHTGDEEDSFAGIGVDPGPGGVPLVRGVPGRFSARRVALLEADGDHACFVVEAGPDSIGDIAGSGPLLRVSDLSGKIGRAHV